MDFKEYYMKNILACEEDNNLLDITRDKLEEKSESELITMWDALRWKYGDLSERR